MLVSMISSARLNSACRLRRGTDEWPTSFPLTAPSITGSAVGESDMMANPKRKPRQGDVDRDTGERRRQEEALD